ncbi:MAG: hypothetical protein H6701_05470 [Myxococcales bacterium]|nr:hypothetical protein [Myxococcales bacterium]
MCDANRIIDEYIRRSTATDIMRAAQQGSDAINGLASDIESIGEELGALVPASALTPLATRLQPLEAKHTQAVQALRTIKTVCQNQNPFFKDDRGAITAEEKRDRVILNTPLFARFKLSAGKISLSMKGKHKPGGFVIFDKGDGDAGDTWGWGTDSITRYHTNLNKEGVLPDGSWFEALGVTLDVQAADGGEVEAADLRIIGDAFAWWTQNQGQSAIPLVHLQRMPPLHRLEQTNGSEAATSVAFVGAPFIQQEPIFRMRAGEKGHGLVVRWPDETKELAQAYILTFRLEGVFGVVPGGIA